LVVVHPLIINWLPLESDSWFKDSSLPWQKKLMFRNARVTFSSKLMLLEPAGSPVEMRMAVFDDVSFMVELINSIREFFPTIVAKSKARGGPVTKGISTSFASK
jgi:hypothetical protein